MRDPRHPRHFTDDFKRQIVNLHNAGKPKREIMDEHDLGKSTVERWIKSINVTGSPRAADNRTREQNRILELERENRRLRTEIDVLKQAALIYARSEGHSGQRGPLPHISAAQAPRRREFDVLLHALVARPARRAGPRRASGAKRAAPGWCARCRGGPGAPTTRAERFFGTLKCDFFEDRDLAGVPFDEFSRLIGEYIEWYRDDKLKKDQGWKTIREYREERGYAA